MALFGIREQNSTVWREVLGGLTTFMAMSYILFVQVAFLKTTGMPVGGIVFATCVASAVGCFLMGLIANYPIALAPGMGENTFFALTVATAAAAWSAGMEGWKPALALVMLVGVVFLLLSLTPLRAHIVRAMPPGIRYGVAAGIGMLIATVGLNFGNLVAFGGPVPSAVPLGDNPVAWLTLIGLAVVLVLTALRVPGAVLISIVVNGVLAAGVFGWMDAPEGVLTENVFHGVGRTVTGAFEGVGGVWAGLTGGFAAEIVAFAIVLLFMDFFDTIGTLVGVAGQAGLMRDGELPRLSRALVADAAGTSIGGALGTSTITSYIESATGVAVGARTGLAAVVAGGCMLLSLLFRPVIELIGGGVMVGGADKHPLVAPALIYVGSLMLGAIRNVDWDDVTEYLPAFLAVIVMPLTMSISHGIGAAFIAYAAGKLLTGRARQCSVVVYVVAALFVGRYVLEVVLEG
jgi:adenine/guanine/hypoxanthine permease